MNMIFSMHFCPISGFLVGITTLGVLQIKFVFEQHFLKAKKLYTLLISYVTRKNRENIFGSDR